MKAKERIGIAGIIATAIILIASIVFLAGQQSASASAPSGLPATMATTSNVTMPAVTVVTVAATSSCTATVVQTGVSAVMLQFGDRNGAALSGTNGTALQAASTTVAYDSGLYGCGKIRAYSYTAQPITISQTN